MAEQEKKRAQEARRQAWDILFEISHKHEMKEFDFKARSFEWQHDGDTRMTCRYQTAEGGFGSLRINSSGILALNEKVMLEVRTTL